MMRFTAAQTSIKDFIGVTEVSQWIVKIRKFKIAETTS